MKSVRKYGVGACGPRGFYGTIGELFTCREDDLSEVVVSLGRYPFGFGKEICRILKL